MSQEQAGLQPLLFHQQGEPADDQHGADQAAERLLAHAGVEAVADELRFKPAKNLKSSESVAPAGSGRERWGSRLKISRMNRPGILRQTMERAQGGFAFSLQLILDLGADVCIKSLELIRGKAGFCLGFDRCVGPGLPGRKEESDETPARLC